MTRIIVATHGPLAAALLESAKMILGETQPGVCAVCLMPEDSLASARDKIESALVRADCGEVRSEANSPGSSALVLVDLFGGTAANAAAWALQDKDFEIVAGVNLPMLLEVLLNRAQMPTAELARLAAAKGKQGVTDIKAALYESRVEVTAPKP